MAVTKTVPKYGDFAEGGTYKVPHLPKISGHKWRKGWQTVVSPTMGELSVWMIPARDHGFVLGFVNETTLNACVEAWELYK